MNLVVLFGVLSSDPTIRQLPSGQRLATLQVTTTTREGRRSVPVGLDVDDDRVPFGAGDSVAVVGSVERRFFRSAGVTRSATEVKAAAVMPIGDRRRVKKALREAGQLLSEAQVAAGELSSQRAQHHPGA